MNNLSSFAGICGLGVIKKVAGTILILGATFFLQGGSCCNTVLRTGAVLGKADQNINDVKEKAGYEVWTCPGKPVTIGWYVSSDVTQVTVDHGIVDAKVPFDSRTVEPTEDTIYTVKATGGSCDLESKIIVHVIKEGSLGLANLLLVRTADRGSYFESYLNPLFFDPNLKMTQISLEQNGGKALNAWQLLKTDTSGPPPKQYQPITDVMSAPGGFPGQWAGNHKVVPSSSTTSYDWSSAPMALTEKVLLSCK